MNVPLWLLVALGGAAGAVARYGLAASLHLRFPHLSWPLGTLVVNVLGCGLAGLLLGLLEKQAPDSPARLLLLSGFCGGFTTFSAFAGENVVLLRGGQVGVAALYAGGSVALGVLAAGLGYWVGSEVTG